jgi:hypothetical protein
VSEAADEGKGIPLTRSSHDLVRKRAETGTQPKSLMRMFSPSGNPQARNLFSVLGHLQKRAGLELHVAQGPS